MRLGALVLVTVLLLPSALAGTERDPEIQDPEDVRDSASDILAAWFSAERDGLRVSIRTVDGSLPGRFPDHVYWAYFEIEETGTEVGAALGFGNDGVLRSHLTTDADGPMGGLNGAQWRGGFERIANDGLVDLSERRGRPSTWSGLIPWGAVDGLEEGARLVSLMAGSAYYDRAQGTWVGGIDRAASDETYVATVRVGPFPILVPGWMIPAIVVASTLGGAAAGLGLAAATRAKPVTLQPTGPAPTPRAPPPGERFRVAPPLSGKR